MADSKIKDLAAKTLPTGNEELVCNDVDNSNVDKKLTLGSAREYVPYSYVVYLNGTTYYAKNTTTGVVDYSGTDFSTVMTSAIAGNGAGGTVFVRRGSYTVNSAISLIGDTTVELDQACYLIVPQDYAGTVFKFGNTVHGSVVKGGELREAGTVGRLWKGIEFEATTGGSYFNTVQDMKIRNAGTAIYLHSAQDAGYVNGNIFKNIQIWTPVIGVEFDMDGAEGSMATGKGINGNYFEGVVIDANAGFSYGFKNITNDANVFVSCYVWDNPSGVSANLLSDAVNTIIIGGTMANALFDDLGTNTRIIDYSQGVKNIVDITTAQTITGAKTFGSAGAVGKLKIAGTTSGSTILDATAAASGTLTLPAATDTLVGKATTDTFTNKTLDTAGTGNSLQLGSKAVSISSLATNDTLQYNGTNWVNTQPINHMLMGSSFSSSTTSTFYFTLFGAVTSTTETLTSQPIYTNFTVLRNTMIITVNGHTSNTTVAFQDDTASVGTLTAGSGVTGLIDSGVLSTAVASGSLCNYKIVPGATASAITFAVMTQAVRTS